MFSTRFLAMLTVGVGLTACAGGGVALLTPAAPSTASFSRNAAANSHPSVVVFGPDSGVVARTLTNGVGFPAAIAVGRNGRLYVANCGQACGDVGTGSVSIYSSTSSMPVEQLPANDPSAIVLDKRGTLFVANASSGQVVVYPPGTTTPSQTISAVQGLSALAIDASGDLLVANDRMNDIQIYKPGATAPYKVLQKGLHAPEQLVFDRSGALYVANCGATCGGTGPSSIAVYAPKTWQYVRSITEGVAGRPSLTLDHNTVYVANTLPGAGSISVYAQASKKPVRRLTAGVNTPQSVLFDSGGNLYVANNAANAITVYPPGSVQPQRTLTSGVNHPAAMVMDSAGNLYIANQGGP